MSQLNEIRTAASRLTYYALEPGDGTRYSFGVGELDAASRGIIRGCDAAYALFVPLVPIGRAYPFRRGREIEPGYWANKTDMHNEWTVLLLTKLWPVLTGAAPTPAGIERAARDLVWSLYYGQPLGEPAGVAVAVAVAEGGEPVEDLR